MRDRLLHQVARLTERNHPLQDTTNMRNVTWTGLLSEETFTSMLSQHLTCILDDADSALQVPLTTIPPRKRRASWG